MSAAAEVQKLVFDRLVADAGVHALIADRIHDRVPANAVAPYASFGTFDVVEDDADCIEAEIVTLQIDVWSEYQGGRLECHRVCSAIKAALHNWAASLTTNALVMIRVISARVSDDPDGITVRGVLTVEAHVELAA